MKTSTMMTTAMPPAPMGKAWEEVSASFDRFCLAAGIDTLGAMMEQDAKVACGPRHARGEERRGHRWGRTVGKIAFHAGKVAIERPRVRGLDGKELTLESWGQAVSEDWLEPPGTCGGRHRGTIMSRIFVDARSLSRGDESAFALTD